MSSAALVGVMVGLVAAGSQTGAQDATRAQQAREAAARARAALELPRTVDSVRKRGGIPESEMTAVIGDVQRRGVPAHEARAVFATADTAIRDHGPVDNFGAFVQGRLAAGLRGRDLARAIREEHARRGIGKGKMAGQSRAPGNANDRAGSDPKGANAKGANAKGANAKGANAKGNPNPQDPAAKSSQARDVREAATRARNAAKAPANTSTKSPPPATKAKRP